jgi:hypothetical protein
MEMLALAANFGSQVGSHAAYVGGQVFKYA